MHKRAFLQICLVVLIGFVLARPVIAEESGKYDLNSILTEVNAASEAENASKTIDIKPFIHEFMGENGRGFDCDKLCEALQDKIELDSLDECRESCVHAEVKVKEHRQLPKCDTPENMEPAPAGSFLIGCTDDCRIWDEMSYVPQIVILTNDLYIDKYEVTQKQFQDVMGFNPAYYKGDKCGDDCPVESVTWDEAKSFCEKAGKRLPTSAEWEYAARAGTTTRHYWGTEINLDYFWYKYNSGKRPKPVGQKLPNKFGLYDMEGNVFEFVQDCKFHYPFYSSGIIGGRYIANEHLFLLSTKILYDPLLAGETCDKRLIRGGSFAYEGKGASVSYEYEQNVNERRGDRGFRCVMDAYGPQCEKEETK